MKRNITSALAVALILASAAFSQNSPEKKISPQPAGQLAEEMAKRLADDLHVKTVIGEPVKAGSVTLIPIVTMDVSFGGAAAPGKDSAPQGGGFYMRGKARPVGFVVLGSKGTRFISVARPPAK